MRKLVETSLLWVMLLLVSACTKASEDLTVPDLGAKVLNCADHASHPMGAGVLLNNMWNKDSAGPGKWRQCLQSRVRNGFIEYGWFWNWPSRDGLYAYPEILLGRSPWGASPTNDPRFPRTIADTRSLWIEYDVESRTSGKKNLAVEFWLSDLTQGNDVPDTQAIKTELMIWTEASAGLVSAQDKPVAVIEIDGAKWTVYVKRNWGDASGGAANKWDLISYHAVVPTPSIKYDARKFFQDAMNRGLLQPGYSIAGVELGNEIVSGAGSTWIKKFEVTVE